MSPVLSVTNHSPYAIRLYSDEQSSQAICTNPDELSYWL